MPVGDEYPVVEESQLLHDHIRNTGASHTPMCVVESVSTEPLSSTEKIEKQHSSQHHVTGLSSSSSAPAAVVFGRACSWSSTCAVVDDVSETEEDPHHPLLHPLRTNLTPSTTTAHYHQSSTQSHHFYEDVDVVSCVGSAGSESPYRRDVLEESSVTSSVGVHYRHRRHSAVSPTTFHAPVTTSATNATTTPGSTSVDDDSTGRNGDVLKEVVKATGCSNDDEVLVGNKKCSESPVDCDPLPVTNKPDVNSINNSSATKRVVVPVKYQGVAVPLVALMPVDPTAKYRKISKTFGTAAAIRVDYELLYRDHNAYVAALKLAAPKVRPSPFPFLHEMRMQRKRIKANGPTASSHQSPNHHVHPQVPTPTVENPHSRYHYVRHHHLPTPSSAHNFFSGDRVFAPAPPLSTAGATPPTYNPQHQYQYSLPSYPHAAPTGGGRPPAQQYHHSSTASSPYF